VTRLLAMVWPDLRTGEPDAARLAAFEPMLDALDDLSPRVEAVDRGVALVDITGLGPLLGDERRIVVRAAALVRAVAPLPVRAGTGDNRWLAVLAARLAWAAHPPPRDGAAVALQALPSGPAAVREALAPLSLELLPADLPTRQRLALFGLSAMGELAALPRSAVGAQFGTAGERLQALARGEDPRPIVPRRRPKRLTREMRFEPSVEGVGATALTLRRCCAELCEQLRDRHLAPGRASLTLTLEDAPELRIQLTFPAPALEPDWIARLLIGRLEQAARLRRLWEEEPRVGAIGLVFDRLATPTGRQLPAFEAQAGRWEELRWSLERLRARFGEGRLWRAVVERPTASLAEQRARLVDIGQEGAP
jgi:nucleotidyltransferase/DNA polymerase involved in DNA repair